MLYDRLSVLGLLEQLPVQVSMHIPQTHGRQLCTMTCTCLKDEFEWYKLAQDRLAWRHESRCTHLARTRTRLACALTDDDHHDLGLQNMLEFN